MKSELADKIYKRITAKTHKKVAIWAYNKVHKGLDLSEIRLRRRLLYVIKKHIFNNIKPTYKK